MKLKLLLASFFISVGLFQNSFAATVTSFTISSSNLLAKNTVYGTTVVALNQTGTTAITTDIQITKVAHETYSLTFSLGTVLGSGSLFAFGGTATLNNNNDGDLNGTTSGIALYSTMNSTQPVLNKLILLVSTNGGTTWTQYTGNSYLTNYPIVQQPLYRYYNSGINKHFYTISPSEVSGNPAWVDEGVPGEVENQSDGTSVPLYRYNNPSNGDHYYTLTKGTFSGYTYEGIGAFVDATQIGTTVPLYEYFSSAGGHFYNSNYSELGGGGQGFTYYGISCYIYPAP